MKRAILGVTLGLCGLMWFGGCAVGPNYKRPPIPSSDSFRGDNAPSTNSFADLAWWQVYQDPVLQKLTREAFANNYDLREAITRVEQSRQLAAQARSQFLPSVNYNASVGQGKNYEFGGIYPTGGSTGGSFVAAANAFWEVDLWGRIRRLNESARAELLASEDARAAVRLTLLSDVATAYFQLVELDEELLIERSATNSFAGSLKIFSERTQGGTASALETYRAQAALADAQASIPAIYEQMALTENQLSILLGRPPGPVARSGRDIDTWMPPQVPAGLPSALLERRPDVRQSEQLLRSANAKIGVSVANFFPTIGLTALLGRVSPELSAASLGTANAWGVAADASGPIFQGGLLTAQYRQAKAVRDEALLQFQQTVLTALGDVANALAQRDHLGEIREFEVVEVHALEEAVRISTERYRAGKASYYEVLEAQQELFPSQVSLARTRRDQLLAVVALYKALGGGWADETKPNPHS